MFSHRDPFVSSLKGDGNALSNRPSSTVLMQLGDKDTKKLIKKKFDLPNARLRDPTKATSNSYKAKLSNPIAAGQKRKDQLGAAPAQDKSAAGLAPKQASTPVLVQYQNALRREKNNVSPFMVSGPALDPAMVTIEAPKTQAQKQVEQ